MKTKSMLLVLALLTVAATGRLLAEPTADNSGLAVGKRAPQFTLNDQQGRPVSLEALLTKGPVALVFYRSADWCQYCRLQLVQLQKNLREFEAAGGQIVAVSYDAPEVLRKFASRNAITYPLLSDAGSKVIDAYDIRNKEAPARWEGVARHATFIIDRTGVIREKLFQVSYQERPAVNTLAKALQKGGLELCGECPLEKQDVAVR